MAGEACDEGGEAPCFAGFLDELDLRESDSPSPSRPPVVVRLASVGTGSPGSDGVLWHLPHDGDLDANLVRLGACGAIGEHVNNEVDVLIVVRSGSAELEIDGQRATLDAGSLALVPRGAMRSIEAGTEGVEYLSIHRRRAGLSIRPSTPA